MGENKNKIKIKSKMGTITGALDIQSTAAKPRTG